MILERLRRGERLRHYETVRVRKDGSEFAVALTISPILDASGTIIGASKIVRDITAERRSQSRIQELQAELAHVARLSTMGQMASAIAHELNQPLTAVSNYAGALGRMLASGECRSGPRARNRRADPPADHPRRRSDQAVARPRRQAQHHAPARGRQRCGQGGGRTRAGRHDASWRAQVDGIGHGGRVADARSDSDRPGDHQPGPQCRGGDGGEHHPRPDRVDAGAAGSSGDRGGRHRPRNCARSGGAAVPAFRHVKGRRASGWAFRSAASWSRHMAGCLPCHPLRPAGRGS